MTGWSVALATTAGAFATAQSASAGGAALFDRLDSNGDGRLVTAEIAPEHRRLFGRLVRRADRNRDGALTRQEFVAGLVPTRPEKPLEEQQPSELPEADAVRWLLLTLDTNRDARIEAQEVPERLQPVFRSMLERIDRNENGRLELPEINRGGPRLSQIAGRYVAREGVDVAAELKRLERLQGLAAGRFDEQPGPADALRNPQQARALFARFDEDGDGKLTPEEVPDPFRPQLERILRLADRDRDGALSEREFVTATERLGRFLRRGRGSENGERDRMPERAAPRER